MSADRLLQEGETFDGPSKTLTDAHFLFFSALSGDAHPIHYDVEYAKGTKFGKPLAHGLLLVSMAALGASTARERLDGLVFVEQGSRFLRPATVGDTVRPRFTLERIWQEGKRRFYRFRTTLLNQRDEILLEGFHVYQFVNDRSAKEAR
jgi:acyl dehydratase